MQINRSTRPRLGSCYLNILSVVIVLTAAYSISFAQSLPCEDNCQGFLRGIVGEWIGVCEQSTDGEQADDKYFHLSLKEVDENYFEGTLGYFKCNAEDGTPVPIGQSTISVKIGPDGTAESRIVGEGIVLVDDKPKKQEHNLQDVLTWIGDGCLEGKGGGTISINGMPLGLGKNGKIESAVSTWTLKDNTLTIDQVIKVGFRFLLFKKGVKFDAHYTATRGTDVASLMRKKDTPLLSKEELGEV